MPSVATITSSDFFTFVAGTPARATQVNSNFNIYRGHIIPVDPNTSAATTNTFDLGSTEYQWRNIFLQNAPLVNGSAIGGGLYIDTVFDGDRPPAIEQAKGDVQRIKFKPNTDSDIRFSFQVISDYSPGNQIGIDYYGFYDVTGPSAALFETRSSLYEPGSTTANTATVENVRTSTATVSLVSTASQFFRETGMLITDINGLINGVTVTALDVISINLKRTGTATGDSATGNVFLTDIAINHNV